jgi:hypothetical protein
MRLRPNPARVGAFCRAVGPVLVVALALAACGRPPVSPVDSDDPQPTALAPPKPAASPRPPAPTDAWTGGLSLQNRVWVVERSNAVAIRSARIFLWDGTLVMTGPGSEPAFGRWVFERGRLRIIEEGIAYETEILESAGDRLRLRLLSPGEPVTLEMRDARPPWVDSAPR